MKRLKSLLSLALILVMALSFAVPVLADGPTAGIPGVTPGVSNAKTPTLEDLDFIQVKFVCKEDKVNHVATYSLKKLEGWNITIDPREPRYQVAVTASDYLPATIGGVTHYVDDINPSTQRYVNVVYKDGRWQPEYYWQNTVYFEVTHGSNPANPTPNPNARYTVTYKWAGSAPYGVSLPVDYNTYAYGDIVTLKLPSKTSVPGYSGNMPGYWVFDGWSVYDHYNNIWNNTNNYGHTDDCFWYDGRWYCSTDCRYYYHNSYYCGSYGNYSWYDILLECREEGMRLDEWLEKNFPLNYSHNNGNRLYYSNVSGTTSNWPNYNGVCNHPYCPDDYCYYWDTYYYGHQSLRVTGDITVYGSWSFQPAGGTLVLSAYTMAASGYNPENYVFEIYSSKNSSKPYKTVTVKAGSNEYVTLDNGTYYLYVVKKDVEGYTLETTVSGDVTTDGAKIVMNGDSVIVKYSSLYSKNGVAFNTKDHVAYLNGYEDGTIKPNENITREEVAAILYRLLDSNSIKTYGSSSNGFSDVKSTRWSNTAISTLVNAGVMSGYQNGSVFKPENNMTRAELVTALVKIAGISGGRAQFTDCSNHWANNAINAAANAGWVTGYENGKFMPDAALTRAEVVTIINRVLNRNPGTVADLLDNMKTFTDNMNPNKWYYMDIQEAANGHTYNRDTDGSEYWTGLK